MHLPVLRVSLSSDLYHKTLEKQIFSSQKLQVWLPECSSGSLLILSVECFWILHSCKSDYQSHIILVFLSVSWLKEHCESMYLEYLHHFCRINIRWYNDTKFKDWMAKFWQEMKEVCQSRCKRVGVLSDTRRLHICLEFLVPPIGAMWFETLLIDSGFEYLLRAIFC